MSGRRKRREDEDDLLAMLFGAAPFVPDLPGPGGDDALEPAEPDEEPVEDDDDLMI